MIKIVPSFLGANLDNIQNEVESVSEVDIIHIDVMDNIFVPNTALTLTQTSEIIKYSEKKIIDVHLMVDDVLKYVDEYAKLGVDYITVHVENKNCFEAIKLIKKKKIKAGISLKPNTKFEEIKSFLSEIDLVLIMSVEPGFGGQSFMIEQVDKIKSVKKIKPNLLVSIDGGINSETIPHVIKSGADWAVAGSFIFNQPPENRNKVIEEAERG